MQKKGVPQHIALAYKIKFRYDEEELEDALEQNITRFLLELGSGFAFIGRQKEIIVAGKTRKIDMLFYHIKLRYILKLKERKNK